MTVPHVWVLISRLKDYISTHPNRMKAGFTTNSKISVNWMGKRFRLSKKILEEFLFNMEFRFPCPSFSIGKRIAYQRLNHKSNRLDGVFLMSCRLRCPINESVGLFPFPDDLLKKHQINHLFVGGKYPEVQLMAREIIEKRTDFVSSRPTRWQENEPTTQTTIITLQDAFKTIKREHYPLLWNVMVRVMS